MQNTDPVEIKDIETGAELTAEEMDAVKGGRGPMYQGTTTPGSDTGTTGGKTGGSTGVTNPT